MREIRGMTKGGREKKDGWEKIKSVKLNKKNKWKQSKISKGEQTNSKDVKLKGIFGIGMNLAQLLS